MWRQAIGYKARPLPFSAKRKHRERQRRAGKEPKPEHSKSLAGALAALAPRPPGRSIVGRALIIAILEKNANSLRPNGGAISFLSVPIGASPAHASDAHMLEQYRSRRADLRKAWADGVTILFGRTEAHEEDLRTGFFQESNFYYLTGWQEPGALCCSLRCRKIRRRPAIGQVPGSPRDPLLTRAQSRRGKMDRPQSSGRMIPISARSPVSHR